MEPTDITVEILRSIRDEIRETRHDLASRIDATNARLGDTNARLDDTNTRLDATNARLDVLTERQTRMEIRLSTELVAVAGAVGEVRDLLKEQRVDRARLDRLEQRVEVLEKRGA